MCIKPDGTQRGGNPACLDAAGFSVSNPTAIHWHIGDGDKPSYLKKLDARGGRSVSSKPGRCPRCGGLVCRVGFDPELGCIACGWCGPTELGGDLIRDVVAGGRHQGYTTPALPGARYKQRKRSHKELEGIKARVRELRASGKTMRQIGQITDTDAGTVADWVRQANRE